jgi:hypothetical protein
MIRGNSTIQAANGELIVVDGVIVASLNDINPDEIAEIRVMNDTEARVLYGTQGSKGAIIVTTKSGAKNKNDLSKIETRKNFNETAFFLPELKTDSSGNISFQSSPCPKPLPNGSSRHLHIQKIWHLDIARRISSHRKNSCCNPTPQDFYVKVIE